MNKRDEQLREMLLHRHNLGMSLFLPVAAELDKMRIPFHEKKEAIKGLIYILTDYLVD
jgi:hypothetical protein